MSLKKSPEIDFREFLNYDPNTGIFTWKVHRGAARIGAHAGHRRISPKDGRTYLEIGLLGNQYPAHQIAHHIMTGSWAEQVDHRDHDPLNNRWDNLRPATPNQNMFNRGPLKNNTSGYKGVYRNGPLYAARICAHGKRTFLGNFQTAEEAGKAYAEAAKTIHGEFAYSG